VRRELGDGCRAFRNLHEDMLRLWEGFDSLRILEAAKLDPVEDLIVPCNLDGEMGRRICGV